MSPLEQLKSVLCDPEGQCCILGSDEDRAIIDRALQALAQPAQEPCGWQFYQDGKWHNGMETSNHRVNTEAAGIPVRNVYPAPPAQPAVQDAQRYRWLRDSADMEQTEKAWKHVINRRGASLDSFVDECAASTPPTAQRTWVELTDEETDTEATQHEQSHGFIQGVQWANTKLKEKQS
jgi:hypothetical protein